MSTRLNFLFLLTAQIVLPFTSFGASAQDADQPASRSTSAAVQTETGQQIPAGAFGVARIDAPRVAALLKLRGVTGRGTVILRSDESHDCLTLPIRLVAGDFGGDASRSAGQAQFGSSCGACVSPTPWRMAMTW